MKPSPQFGLPFKTERVLAWFSCGAASAVAAKLTVEKYPDIAQVLYCDTLAHEHPDNRRFMDDVAKWIGRPVILLRSTEYSDIYDVFERTRWLIGNEGARCTTELKKVVRKDYQRVDDLHIFGFTADESRRVKTFFAENPDLAAEFPLIDQAITKVRCFEILREAGIALPAMYLMGYKNNNCIGCVKGGAGYWNKIRKDFPEQFARMAAMERTLGASILKDRKGGEERRLYLDELPPTMGRYKSELSIECGVVCEHGVEENHLPVLE